MLETAEPTQTAAGRRVAELLAAPEAHDLEPETAALLSAADRTEHVAAVIRPALDRGEVVVCDGFLLTSVAVHGGGRGGDPEQIREINGWSTGDLRADLTVIVDVGTQTDLSGAFAALDLDGVRHAYDDELEAHPGATVRCTDEAPDVLPESVAERLQRVVHARASLLASPAAEVSEPVDLVKPDQHPADSEPASQ